MKPMTTQCKIPCVQNSSKTKIDKKLVITGANGGDNFKETWDIWQDSLTGLNVSMGGPQSILCI